MIPDDVISALEKEFGPLLPVPPKPRDWCDWCQGKGCVACATKRRQLEEEYARQFPNGPQPIFTAKLDDPKQMQQAVDILHADRIVEAFGPNGGGVEEIEEKCRKAMSDRVSEGKP